MLKWIFGAFALFILLVILYQRFWPDHDAVCWMIFGPPGCGKTTLAVKYAQQALKNGRKVYTNFPCKDCLRLETDKIGLNQYRNALCIVDEAGIDFNNRDFKKFPKHTMEYAKLHRHYGTDFIFLSQGWDDCDKKLRTLCSQYYYLGKIGPVTYVRRIRKRVGVDEQSHDIVDAYLIPHFWSRNALAFCFRPAWYRYFDSWHAPTLPDAPETPWSVENDATGGENNKESD